MNEATIEAALDRAELGGLDDETDDDEQCRKAEAAAEV